MTPERSHAYRRVLHTLSEVGPSKLLEREQTRIRNAADELIFARHPDAVSAGAALEDVEILCDALVECGRWERSSASKLLSAVTECGPAREPAAQAA